MHENSLTFNFIASIYSISDREPADSKSFKAKTLPKTTFTAITA